MSVELVDPWNLKEVLYKSYLKDQGVPQDEIYSADITPSMLVNSDQGPYCDRYLGYKAIGTIQVPQFDYGLLKIWEAGNAIHDKLQERLGEAMREHEEQVQFEVVGTIPELQMRMRADGQLGNKHGLEIKTLSAGQYKKVIQSGKPLQSHLDQCLFYFIALGWETCTYMFYCMDGFHDIEVMVQVGPSIDLSDLEGTEAVMRADAKRYEMYRRRILDDVLDPVNRGELPPTYRGRWCRSCPYLGECLRDGGIEGEAE